MVLTIHEIGGSTISLLSEFKNSHLRPMNPTIIEHQDRLLVFFRLIDSTVDDDELYILYRNYESEIGMAELNKYSYEVIPGSIRKVAIYPENVALKIEDVRAYSRNGSIYLAGALLTHGDNYEWFDNNMVELLVGFVDNQPQATFIRQLPKRWPGSREKNWTVPSTADANFDFIVDPMRVFTQGSFKEFEVPEKFRDTMRGGSQAIPIMIDGVHHWMAIMHKQIMLDDDMQSWVFHNRENTDRLFSYYSMLYTHYVVIFDNDGKLFNIGRPFVFDNATVEFVCGVHDKGDTLLISYGYRDRECRLAIVPKWRLLNFSFPYTGLNWTI